MQIKRLQVLNFQGITDQREYQFTSVIHSLCQKNGAGKTSFLNALRYAVTGNKPAGEMISSGASSSAVGIDTVDGVSFIRQDIPSKGSKCYINRKPVSKKALDDEILYRTGVDSATGKVIMSSEVLASLKPQEFSEFLLSYIPEKLSREQVLGYAPELTEGAVKFASELLPDEGFSVDAVAKVYDSAFAERRGLKKKVSELEGTLRAIGKVEKPEHTAEEYVQMQNELQKQQADAIIKIKARAAYDKLKASRVGMEKQIAVLEEEMKTIMVPDTRPDREALAKQAEEERKQIQQINIVLGTLRQNLTAMKKSLETLDQPVCPLSKKLVCTTDKTVVRKEIEESIQNTEQAVKEQESLLAVRTDAGKAAEEALLNADHILTLFKEKASKMEQIKKIREGMPELPEEPEAVPNADELINEMRALIQKQKQAEQYVSYVAAGKEYQAAAGRVKDLDSVVTAFSPKGAVKQSVTAYYLSVFEDECNERAEELKPGMRLKFVSDDGVLVYADVAGSGTFRYFKNLSGGEQIYVLFLLMDMLNRLTGFRMLIFDELSVLDRDSYAAFVKLVKANEEDYDLVLLASAEHDDILEVNQQEGILPISV